MKYMLLIYGDEQVLDAEEREKCYGESAGLARDLNASGKYLGASPPTSRRRRPASACATGSGW
jgi:hypothetical protein